LWAIIYFDKILSIFFRTDESELVDEERKEERYEPYAAE